MLEFSQKLKLIKFALMIIIFHIVMAIFHERIMRRPYDSHNNEPPERFSYAIAFVGVQCFVYSFVAKGQYCTKQISVSVKYLNSIFFSLLLTAFKKLC